MDNRRKVEKDLVNWKIEYEEGYNGITDEEIEEWETKITSLSDDELEDWWHSNVGEWIISRGYDSEEQFLKLTSDDKEVDYGYVSYKYSQPY